MDGLHTVRHVRLYMYEKRARRATADGFEIEGRATRARLHTRARAAANAATGYDAAAMSKVNITRPDGYYDFYDDFLDDGVSVAPKALRAKIRTFLETWNVTATSFQKVIAVNSNSYGKFMTMQYKNQWSATSNGTYMSAAYFFYVDKKLGKDSITATLKRGQAVATSGITSSMAQPLVEPNSNGVQATAGLPSSSKSSVGLTPRGMPKTARPAQKPPLPDLSSVNIDERVFLNPKEVRAEISAIKRRYKCNNASIGRAVGEMNSQPGAAVSRFLDKGGDFGGGQMEIYRPLAHFCEKFRVYENKPKSAKRIMLEAEAGDGSPYLGHDTSRPTIFFPGAFLAKDNLGRLHYHSGY